MTEEKKICPICKKELICYQEVDDDGSVLTQYNCTDKCGYWINE